MGTRSGVKFPVAARLELTSGFFKVVFALLTPKIIVLVLVLALVRVSSFNYD